MSGSWWQMDITCRPEDTDAVAATVVTATGYGVEELASGRIRAVASSDLDGQVLGRELADHFTDVTTTVTPIVPVDWSVHWRDGIVTRRFGRLVLTPSWLPVEPAATEVVLVLDPESAFGSGEHGSTRAALTLLERHVRGGDMVLDFGSGSGVLAIAAALLGASSAVGVEIDEESIPIAEGNAERNGVAGQVRFLLGDAGQL
ncbi:MAG: 50S ribosomal protein L11 methyltransferase, partial [Gemmatimonadota bacterium]